jgi:hypothetical protein
MSVKARIAFTGAMRGWMKAMREWRGALGA